MNISVIGCGYVGLVAASCFAKLGNQVVCIDNDPSKITSLNNNEMPIYEPGLKEIVIEAKFNKLIKFTTDLTNSINSADIIIIAVGTPSTETGEANLDYVFGAIKSIAPYIAQDTIIIVKSTVPVGTTNKVNGVLRELTLVKFDTVFCPEFLKEGTAINDFMYPDRIVIGTNDEDCKERLKVLYSPVIDKEEKLLFMDVCSAELTKYASNAMLATRISFMNDMARLCEVVDANVDMVRLGMGLDSRIGSRFLYAGAGYGGSCFGKDIKAIISLGESVGVDLNILKAVQEINERQKNIIANKILMYFNNNLKDITIGILGLAFKPGTNDLRDAPSLITIDKLLNAGAKIRVFDPVAMDDMNKIYGTALTYCDNMYETCEGTHALVLLTEWSEFRAPDFEKIGSLMLDKNLYDGRNIWNAKEVKNLGFNYYRFGKK